MASVRKMMGYGLVDVALDDREKIIDPRINTSSILLDWDREHEATVREFVRSTLDDESSLDRVLSGWHYSHLNPDATTPFDCVQHLSDTDIPQTLMLRPVDDSDWYRSNNLLDAIEEGHVHGRMYDRVETLRGGIYPYGNRYVDLETFEPVKWDHIGDWVRAINTPEPDQRKVESAASDAARYLGLDHLDAAGLLARIVPCPPESVIELAAFGELFTKPEYVYQLRPMLATWWL